MFFLANSSLLTVNKKDCMHTNTKNVEPVLLLVKTKAQDTPLSLCMCPPAFTLLAVEPSTLPPSRLGNVQTSLTLLSACRRFVGSARLRLVAKVTIISETANIFKKNIS